MSHARSDEDIIKSKYNISRFFVEQRHVAWVMLIAVCVWGFYSYRSMPQRKDPDSRQKRRRHYGLARRQGGKGRAMVTRKVEEKIAQNARVDQIRSISHKFFSCLCRFG